MPYNIGCKEEKTWQTMMKKYCQLDEKSKAIVRGSFEDVAKEIKKKDD